MRGLKTTIALVVVLGGLFAYIYFVTWKQPDGGAAASKKEKVFAGLVADKVDEIRVHSESGDSTVLKKDKDGWKVTEPVATPAQESEATGIANALAQIEVARVIDENPANLVDYGLGAPRVEIQFKAAGDKDLRSSSSARRRQPARTSSRGATTTSVSSPSRPSRTPRSTGRRSTCATRRRSSSTARRWTTSR